MARFIIENISLEQAKELANWYEGQGEQDAGEWFDIHGISVPCVNVSLPHWKEIDGDAVRIYCKA